MGPQVRSKSPRTCIISKYNLMKIVFFIVFLLYPGNGPPRVIGHFSPHRDLPTTVTVQQSRLDSEQ